MLDMDRGERELSNGIKIMKIGRFDKFTVDSVSKMAIRPQYPRRVRTRIFIGRACWGMEVTLFDSPSPEDSKTGLRYTTINYS